MADELDEILREGLQRAGKGYRRGTSDPETLLSRIRARRRRATSLATVALLALGTSAGAIVASTREDSRGVRVASDAGEPTGDVPMTSEPVTPSGEPQQVPEKDGGTTGSTAVGTTAPREAPRPRETGGGTVAPPPRTGGTSQPPASTIPPGEAGVGDGTVGASPPAPPPPTTTVASSGDVVLTEDHEGATVRVAPGRGIEVRLSPSSGVRWTTPASSDEAVVATLSRSAASDGSAQGTFVARASGSATLSAKGEYPCSGNEACMRPNREYRVTIVVG